MKKALLLALVGLFAAIVPALAYPPAPANVNFASERGVPFGLVLDGRPLTRGMARQVHVDRLVPGLHWADFSVPTAYGGAMRFRSRVWLEPGLETTFVLVARPGRPLGLQQVNAVALHGPGQGYGNGYNNGGNNGGYGGGNNGYGGGQYNSPQPYPNQPGPGSNGPYNNANPNQGGPNGYDYNNTPDPNNGSNGYGNNPNGPAGSYDNTPDNSGYYPGSTTSSYRLMQPQDVDALVLAVQQRSFEDGKLSMAKNALAQSSLQADDLKRLLTTLSFEASRVELAKFAYPHVADRQNFYRVYQAFNFEASKREVEQAVAAMPQN